MIGHEVYRKKACPFQKWTFQKLLNEKVLVLTSRYCFTILLFTSSVILELAISLRKKSNVCLGWKWTPVFRFIALSYTFADSDGEYFWILLFRENKIEIFVNFSVLTLKLILAKIFCYQIEYVLSKMFETRVFWILDFFLFWNICT